MKDWLKFGLIAILGLVLTISVTLSGNSQPSRSNLIQQAQSAYSQGAYQESLTLLEAAEQNFIKNNQTLQQAQLQSFVSLTQQKLGNWDKAQEAIDYGLALIATSANNATKQQILAQIWNTQGKLYFGRGKIKQALSAWETASQWYQQSGDLLGEKGANINRAQALESLGFLRRACEISLKTLDLAVADCEDLKVCKL